MEELHVKEAIDAYYKQNPVRLHMPGHKCSKRFLKAFDGAKKDLTEIDALDLSLPVKRAEEDVAKICNANFCRMLVNGATCGIFAMLYAVKDLGSKIIVNRTAHKSVFNALTVLGIEPIIVNGENVNGGQISVEETISALIKNPDAIGVFYTYPDYYGKTFDIENVYKAVKEAGKLLLIDNAHGAHLAFDEKVVYAGKFADLWVDSAHKSLATLNQGAVVFCAEERFAEKLDNAVNVFMTTSPSYPLLASIEYGFKFQSQKGKRLVREKIAPQIKRLMEYVASQGLTCYSFSDKLKLILDCGKSGINAYSAEKILIDFKIYPEMNDGSKILLMFSAMNKQRDFKRLKRAVKSICKNAERQTEVAKEFAVSKREIGYLKAKNSPFEMVELEKAIGRISACDFGIFPPCYPLVLAGEVISKESVGAVLTAVQTFGIKDGLVKVVK